MRILTLGSGTDVYINNSSTQMQDWTGNTDYVINGNISYKTADMTNSEPLIGIISDNSDDKWHGVSRLNVNMSPEIAQKLESNHRIVINGEESNNISGYDSTYVKSSIYIDAAGAKTIDVRGFDLVNDSYFNSSMIGYNESAFSVSPNSATVSEYEGGYRVSIPYNASNNVSYTVSVNNQLIAGNYAFAVTGSNKDISIDDVTAKRGGVDLSNISSGNESKYFNFSSSSDELSESQTNISITRISDNTSVHNEFIYIKQIFGYSDGNITPEVFNRMKAIDADNEFDYSYDVNLDTEIKDPTSASSFFDTNHIFNKFTLPHITNISATITNVKK